MNKRRSKIGGIEIITITMIVVLTVVAPFVMFVAAVATASGFLLHMGLCKVIDFAALISTRDWFRRDAMMRRGNLYMIIAGFVVFLAYGLIARAGVITPHTTITAIGGWGGLVGYLMGTVVRLKNF